MLVLHQLQVEELRLFHPTQVEELWRSSWLAAQLLGRLLQQAQGPEAEEHFLLLQ